MKSITACHLGPGWHLYLDAGNSSELIQLRHISAGWKVCIHHSRHEFVMTVFVNRSVKCDGRR